MIYIQYQRIQGYRREWRALYVARWKVKLCEVGRACGTAVFYAGDQSLYPVTDLQLTFSFFPLSPQSLVSQKTLYRLFSQAD